MANLLFVLLSTLAVAAPEKTKETGEVKLETTCYDKNNQIVHVNVATEITIAIDKDKGENTIKTCIVVVK